VKTPLLVSGIVLLALVAGGGGYLGGQRLEPEQRRPAGQAVPLPTGSAGTPTPRPTSTPSVPLIRKTPQPNPLEPLNVADLEFKTRNFTVTGEVAGELKMSIRVPAGWELKATKEKSDEVRFVDPSGERAVRVQSALTSATPVKQALQDLLTNLQSSQPYQNYVQALFQGEGQVKDDDGNLRQVATLVYTYIPGASTRYVLVRFIATGDGDVETVSMSVTGLPKDKKALEKILAEATASVRNRD
jgi:hypothetical protein